MNSNTALRLHMEVDHCGLKAVVAEEFLDMIEAYALLEQISGKAVAQRMNPFSP